MEPLGPPVFALEHAKRLRISVTESGEVTYTSQYRIHIENTMIAHRTDTHTFVTFESTKRRTDQNSKQKIEMHILGVGQHTRSPRDSDDHTIRPKPKEQYTYCESPSIANEKLHAPLHDIQEKGPDRGRFKLIRRHIEQPATHSTTTFLIHSHSYHPLDRHHRSLDNHFSFYHTRHLHV